MKRIKVWDSAVRLFHWALVIAFLLSSYSAFQDKVMTGYEVLHLNSGLAILVLLTSRIIWGFVGSTTAKFTSFVRGPSSVWAHMKEIRGKKTYDYVGHNPLGGYFVLFFVFALMTQAIMGLYSNDDILFEGPLASTIDSDLSFQVTAYHKLLGLGLMLLAFLHIASVLVYFFIKRIDLIRPMVTGNKVVSDNYGELGKENSLTWRSPLWALIILFASGYFWYWYIF